MFYSISRNVRKTNKVALWINKKNIFISLQTSIVCNTTTALRYYCSERDFNESSNYRETSTIILRNELITVCWAKIKSFR